MREKVARELEAGAGVSIGWLDNEAPPNFAPMPLGHPVLLISSVRAGNWGQIDEHQASSDTIVYARAVAPGPHTFALKIEGDSMTAQDGLSFPEGAIIIVEPGHSPRAGDFVVAKDLATHRATFKN